MLNRAEPIGLECEGEYRHTLERATVKYLDLLRRERRPAEPKERKMEEA